jgi:hypothetical protein
MIRQVAQDIFDSTGCDGSRRGGNHLSDLSAGRNSLVIAWSQLKYNKPL